MKRLRSISWCADSGFLQCAEEIEHFGWRVRPPLRELPSRREERTSIAV
jgi:hypothetical protein